MIIFDKIHSQIALNGACFLFIADDLMTVEFSVLHKILKDPTRRTIVKCLNDNGPMTYVELMKSAEIANTGRFNYHLKALGGLIEKQDDGRYDLTERGHLAVQLIDKFPEKVQKGEGKTKRKKIVGILAVVCIIVASISLYSYNWYSTQNELAKPVNVPYNGVLMDITGSGGQDWNAMPHRYYVAINFNNTGFLYNAQIDVHYLAVNGSWMDVSTQIPEPISQGTGGGVFTENCQYVPGTKYATPLYFTPSDNLTVIKVAVTAYRNP